MKNIWLIGSAALTIAIIAAIFTAIYTGEKSKIIVAGKIKIAHHLQAKAQRIQTLFIVLRDAQSKQPMPYGAYVDRTGNYNFLLTQDNIQLMGAVVEPTSLNIKARLDADGKAGIDQQGDLVGELKNVAVGTTDVLITIDQEVGVSSQY